MSASNIGSLANDIALPSDSEDTIQSLSWSPLANHLAAASWDGKVRIYDVASTGSAKGVAALTAEAPVFSCDWAKDGETVVAGGADAQIHIMDVSTGQQQVIGSHDAPVRGVRFAEVPGRGGAMVVSGSWDKTIKFWDVRQPPQQQRSSEAVATLSFDERVYSLDVKANLLVVATADFLVHLVDLRNPVEPFETVDSPLGYQTKVVTAFPDGKGWATASIEGRCGINAVDEDEARDMNFAFICHRGSIDDDPMKQTKIWAVNDVQFHPVHSTKLVTAGSDGAFCFWDRAARTKLITYPPVVPSQNIGDPSNNNASSSSSPSPITATAFNRDGSILAYALGYDWSRGCQGNSPRTETRVMLHAVLDEDLRSQATVRPLDGLYRKKI
ncbi:WD40-repeat-containing domain protein [Xylaria sp. FL1777]|nr:WD40-repeat-containing domain protein [Xylaria sp. FL1777]